MVQRILRKTSEGQWIQSIGPATSESDKGNKTNKERFFRGQGGIRGIPGGPKGKSEKSEAAWKKKGGWRIGRAGNRSVEERRKKNFARTEKTAGTQAVNERTRKEKGNSTKTGVAGVWKRGLKRPLEKERTIVSYAGDRRRTIYWGGGAAGRRSSRALDRLGGKTTSFPPNVTTLFLPSPGGNQKFLTSDGRQRERVHQGGRSMDIIQGQEGVADASINAPHGEIKLSRGDPRDGQVLRQEAREP